MLLIIYQTPYYNHTSATRTRHPIIDSHLYKVNSERKQSMPCYALVSLRIPLRHGNTSLQMPVAYTITATGQQVALAQLAQNDGYCGGLCQVGR
jgi:hypothetical protein